MGLPKRGTAEQGAVEVSDLGAYEPLRTTPAQVLREAAKRRQACYKWAVALTFGIQGVDRPVMY
jgi:hypothetical protein